MKKCVVRWALMAWLLLTGVMAAAAADPVKFSFACDSRGKAGFVSVMEQLKAAGGPGECIITQGDMDPAETTHRQLEGVFGKSVAWYPVVGNHELDDKESMPFLRTYFDKQLKNKVLAGPAGTHQTTYSFDVGQVHIAVLNEYWNGQTGAGSDTKGDDVVPALRDWLSNDLKASKKPWKLVVGHMPAYPKPDRNWDRIRHVGESLDAHASNRDAFWKMLDEQGVAAYLCGHTHGYSRYQPKGSKVWQIDTAQARGDKDWKFDAFVIVTAEESRLNFDVYRNLEEKGKFKVTDKLTLSAH